ncbi:MAG: cyclase family protein [Magnetococcales bacterium]|nr:cyclase family protein [Magnetococcales bacterium]NGZ28808.1 cyclase family protein [Magnetococcales bacterium]
MTPRMIDLTFPICEGMQTFAAPWHPLVEITQMGRHGIENRETRKLVIGTHTGTHVDAPLHFIRRGSTVDQIPLDVLIGPATVVDLSDSLNGEAITPEKLTERVNNRSWERLLLRFDWDNRWMTNAYYEQHPFLEENTARLLVEKGCRLLAMDTPQADNPLNGRQSQKDSPIHKILLGSGVILVEYLCHLNHLTRSEVTFIAAPLKILGGDGSPARCFAIEE